MVEEVPCRIYIESEDPDGLAGVNREKMQKSQMARYKITKKYSDALENKDQWCIAAVPSYAWAKKVFPNETKNKAYAMLWDAILETVYVTKDNDPEDAWKAHNADLKARTAYLTEKKFDYLEYKSSNGTDFKVSLIPESHWCGGGENTLSGNFFNPNLTANNGSVIVCKSSKLIVILSSLFSVQCRNTFEIIIQLHLGIFFFELAK